MSARIAELIFRFRIPLSAAILLGFVAMLPLTNVTAIDNDISMWISRDDPVYRTYERFRQEFGGQRSLLIALRSERLFTPEGLEFVRQVTDEIERIDTVERAQSLSTANIVSNIPPDEASASRRKPPDADFDDGGIEVQPLLDEAIDEQAAARVRQRVLNDPLLRGDLVSADGTVTAIIVTFDEDRIDDVRGEVVD